MWRSDSDEEGRTGPWMELNITTRHLDFKLKAIYTGMCLYVCVCIITERF